MNSAEVLIKFKGDSNDADKATDKLTSKIEGLAKSFTLGTLAAKGITKAISVFNSGLDSAINRVDTLNNFPKVMSNLGISAEDSKEVIQDLSEKLKGIPTTLDTAAASVQRFTSKNGDVKESEKLFLAVNNAILAGGASSEIQSTALEQLSQAYAKGKPDMMEWRSLMTAMPAQLTQVAKAMGYVDAASLGEAVRDKDGAEEFSRMMDTMVRMNTEGVNGFKSFDEQARNATGGISTSVKNMRTAFVRGIGNIISSVNEALEPVGGLSGVLAKIGKVGEQAFSKVGKALKVVIPMLINIGKWIKKNQALLKPLVIMVATFVATFKTIKTVVSIIKAVKTAMALLNAVILANPISLLVAAIAALVVGFIYLWNNCEAFRNFWINLWNIIKQVCINIINGIISFFQSIPQTVNNIVNAIIGFINNLPEYLGFVLGFMVGLIANFFLRLWEFITNDIPNIFTAIISWLVKFVTQDIPNFISNVIKAIASLPGKIWNVLVDMYNKAKAGITNVSNVIVDTMKKLPGQMLDIGRNIVKGIWDGINGAKDWIGKKINQFADGFVKGFRKALGIHSPSVIMEKQIGVNVGLGVVEGIDDTKKQINEAIGGISASMTAGIGSNFSAMGTMQSSNIRPIINVYNNMELDPLGQVVSNVKTFSGGAKNDYNYGVGV